MKHFVRLLTTLFPIHNGTFDLSLHSWREPFEKIDIEASKRKIEIIYPKMGEVISILEKNNTQKWWKRKPVIPKN